MSGSPPTAREAAAAARVTVRAATLDDVPAFVATFSDPGVVYGTLQIPHPTTALWQERLERMRDDGTSRMLVAETDAGEVVGNLGLQWSDRPRRRHVGSLGMAVRDDCVGQGVGTALLAAAVELADRWLALHRLELEVYSDNDRGIGLYRRFGFVEEGRSRDDAWRDGAYVDALKMARISPIA